ncbi:MAG: GNAT family N-acetyltransferase [Cyclobacterium sp.]|uniref:GNAT family N-acetyltransferase n=1 Tax=Cyclobacterium sp. TaxID=1966343 RepID=UPI00397100E5
MKVKIELAKQEDKNILIKLIEENDSLFFPPISKRLELPKYVDKIFEHGFPYVAKINNEIAGFCFFYANDIISKRSFLSLILVKEKYRKSDLKIGILLMKNWFKIAKGIGINRLELEVAKKKITLINWYKSLGFYEKKSICRDGFGALILTKHV